MILEIAKWNISIKNHCRRVSGHNVIVSEKGYLILYSTPLRNKPHNHIHILVCQQSPALYIVMGRLRTLQTISCHNSLCCCKLAGLNRSHFHLATSCLSYASAQ